MEKLTRALVESKFFTILLGIFFVMLGIMSHNAGLEYEQSPIMEFKLRDFRNGSFFHFKLSKNWNLFVIN